MYFPTSRRLICLGFSALIVLTGCGKHGGEKPAGQVAAKVNADEITISQINGVLARTPGISPEELPKAKSAVLEKLIDQQLAKQQAIENKIDRLPQVVQAIEAARDEILARAYLEKKSADLPKPTPEAVKKYYNDHPELFSDRRVYNLEELVVEPKEGMAATLREQVAKAKSLQDVATWLQANGVKFSASRGVRPAEALPLEFLPQIYKLKDGGMSVIEVPSGGVMVFRLVASQSAPIVEAAATPRIQQFLFNQQAAKAMVAEIKALRDKADISYQGEFAGGAAAMASRAKAEADVEAKQLAKDKAAADAEEQVKAAAKAKAEADSKAQAEAIAKARAAAEADAASRKQSDAKGRAASTAAPLKQESIDKGLNGLR